MIYDRPLTAEQRKKSQLNYNRFSLVNGASYMCLGESVIVLFAIRLGMSNAVISLVGAMIYLGFVLLPLGVWSTAHHGAARSQADFWVCRNIAALLVAASVVVNQYSSLMAEITLLSGACLFYGFRAAGCAMGQPLIADISSEEECPALIGRSVANFYISGMIAMAVISIVLRLWDNLYGLVGIIVFGAICGVTSSTFIRNIDESSAIRESAKKPILSGLGYVLHTPLVFKLIRGWFVANLAILMTVPMSLLALKRGYAVSDTDAILFSLVQFGASICGCRWGIGLTKNIGPRKIIILGFLLLIPVVIFWIIPPAASWFTGVRRLILLLPFVIQGFGGVFVNNGLTNYFLLAVPKEKQVGSSMLVSLITGAAAGMIGMPLASGFMNLAEHLSGNTSVQQDIFRWYFGFVLVFLLGVVPLLLRLDTVIIRYREEFGEEALDKAIRPDSVGIHRG